MSTSKPLPSLLLVGAGKMGMAMFEGWLADGLAPSVAVRPSPLDLPAPHRHLASLAELGGFRPQVVVIAVKPQKAAQVLPELAPIVQSSGALVISVMAGIDTASLDRALGGGVSCIRAMPNTPAAIGRGVSLAYAPPGLGDDVRRGPRALATRLLAACGDVVWLEEEAQMDPATAISGCGPAYVFLLAELLEAAAVAHGLPAPIARQLARRTISGSGGLLDLRSTDAAELRRAVTSPNGVTERALAVLMQPRAWPAAIDAAIDAAARRSAELADELSRALAAPSPRRVTRDE